VISISPLHLIKVPDMLLLWDALLGTTLDDVSAAAVVAHARSALLRAATSLFASLSRYAACFD
jgi:hypothetical protein